MKILFFTLLFLLNNSYGQAEVPAPVNPHNYDKKDYCSSCHIAAEIPKLNHDVITTCVKCHPSSISNHPVSRHPISVNASYKVNIPEWMPLSKEGKLVCYTCHDYHNRSGLKRMLRVDYETLCTSCHAIK